MTPVLVVTNERGAGEDAVSGFPSDVEVDVAADARSAWSLLQSRTPAVVVVDLRTGSAGGFALARDMKANARLSKVPILMLLERDQDGWLAKQAGATRWLVKPVGIENIVSEAVSLFSDAA